MLCITTIYTVHPRLSEPFVQTKNIFVQTSENLDISLIYVRIVKYLTISHAKL